MVKHIETDEVAKYRKKKNSGISDSAKKSNHKHKYKQVLLRSPTDVLGKRDVHISIGRVCEICGKHHIDQYFVTEKTDRGTYLMLDQSRVLEKYSHLDIVDIESEW